MAETVIVEALNVHVPVTAVCFAGDPIEEDRERKQFLLSGSGGFVSVFDLNSYDLLSVVNVLGSRNIHGFSVKADESLEICAFGERFVAIFKLKDDILQKRCCSQAPFSFPDRVLDVRWLKGQGNLAVLLAHNEFQLFDPSSQQIVQIVRCEQNSVLFSGLIVDSPGTLFVIAGACLGYLYLWQPLEATGGQVQVQLNLSNAGGVFCMAMKDDWRSLAIACEDRGIYVFNVDWPFKKIETLQTLFGHGARIWKVSWAENYLVTAGEDCQILLWNLANGGSVVHQFQSSSNTNFFALAIDPLNTSRIAAGLSDGSVMLYNAKSLKTETCTTERPGDDPAVTMGDRSEHLVCLRFVDADTIIYVSNNGKLALLNFPGNSSQPLDTNPHYSMAVVLATKRIEENRSLVSLAHGVPSDITVFYLIRESKDLPWCLNKLAEFRSPGNMPRAYLLGWLTGGETVPKMFVSNFDVAANCVFDIYGTKLIEFDLAKAIMPPSVTGELKQFTKIAITSGANFSNNIFVFGDSCGSVLVARATETAEAIFLQVFPHIHGRDGCHSISFSTVNENTIISCGGASSVCFFRVETENSDNPLTLLNTVKPCSSLDFTIMHFEEDKREFVCGFAQKSFMLSEIQPSQLTLTKHYCSGRKREWDLFLNQSEPLSLKFAYIRAGQAYMVPVAISSSAESREVGLQTHLHGLRIHDCKFICHLPVSDSFVFVLASEDDTGSVVAIEDRKGTSIHGLHRLAGHVSGVRCVQVVKQSPNKASFLLFTGGSRGIVIAWTLSLGDVPISSLKNSTFCRKIAQISLTNQPISSFDLPGSSQVDLPKGSWRQSKILGPPLAPDMRFMDVATIHPSNTGDNFRVHVLTACSDATVRIFELKIGCSGNVTTFDRVLCLSEGLSFCQLKVTFAPISLDETGFVVSGDTGGHLNFWHWPRILSKDESEKPISVRIHQSGINALQITKASEIFNNQNSDDKSLIAFTGGDDTALVVSKFSFENSEQQLQCATLLRINSAHSSQISGLSFIQSAGLICTISIDQRLRFWKFPSNNNEDSRQAFVGGYVTCVADCSSLSVATKNSITKHSSPNCATSPNNLFILVVGEGCQFVKMHSERNIEQ